MDKSSKFLLSVSFAAVVVVAGIIAILIDAFTNVPDFREMRAKVVVPIKLSNGAWTTREMGPKAPGWAPVSQISNHVLMAVISSEDTSFFSHKGVDYHELQEAIKKDWEEKRWARGASTLTQQVVKNVYLGRQKTLWRKFKEFLWAREIEKVLSKTEILCFYLNMVEWGPDIYGIREAANHYFGTAPSALTAKQAAFLAVLLPSPIKYHIYFKKKELTPWSRGRIAHVLRVMNQMGFIEDDVYTAALKEKLWGVTGELGPEKDGGETLPAEDPNQGSEPGKPEDVLKEPDAPVSTKKELKKETPVDMLKEPNETQTIESVGSEGSGGISEESAPGERGSEAESVEGRPAIKKVEPETTEPQPGLEAPPSPEVNPPASSNPEAPP